MPYMTSAYESGAVPPIEVKHRLRIAREHAGLEQEELADLIGVSRKTIGSTEKGHVKPRKITLRAWAFHCKVPLSWIESGANEGPPDDGRSVNEKQAVRPVKRRRSKSQPSGWIPDLDRAVS